MAERVHQASQLAAGDRVSFLWRGEPIETTLYRRGDVLMAINPDAPRYGDDEPSDITFVLRGGSINPNATHILRHTGPTLRERLDALSWEMCPRDGKRLRDTMVEEGR